MVVFRIQIPLTCKLEMTPEIETMELQMIVTLGSKKVMG